MGLWRDTERGPVDERDAEARVSRDGGAHYLTYSPDALCFVFVHANAFESMSLII